MRLKYIVFSILGITSGASLAAAGNNPASIDYVMQYVNHAIQSIATGPTGATGATGANGETGATGATGAMPQYAVGDVLPGGVVVYVDQSGQHGLIVAAQDMGTISGNTITTTTYPAMGYTGTFYVPQSQTGTGIGGGALNTAAIRGVNGALAQSAAEANLANYAAGVTSLYTGSDSTSSATFQNCGDTNYCQGGFYLPNYQELMTAAYYLCQNASSLPSGVEPLTSGRTYWLSTNTSSASAQTFDTFPWTLTSACPTSITTGSALASTDYYVRPVRYF